MSTRLWKVLERIEGAAESVVLIGIMVALFGLVILQVAARLTDHPPSWTEEVSRYLMVWLTFLGAAVCVRHNEHVGFSLLADMLGGAVGRALRRIAQLATLALMLVLLVQGAFWVRSVMESGQTTITFSLPIFVVGLAVPIAGAIGTIYAIQRLFAPVDEKPSVPLEAE
jgi:C4-dicarboxylate transporter, DctQ subunit